MFYHHFVVFISILFYFLFVFLIGNPAEFFFKPNVFFITMP
ncbi:hypothetical protein FCR2A7T_12770 [Flavobacterium cauense R2A-7]|nr:hypothetical protein FCR2A7T_12770 [Flavobacterium cauense R2A-7]